MGSCSRAAFLYFDSRVMLYRLTAMHDDSIAFLVTTITGIHKRFRKTYISIYLGDVMHCMTSRGLILAYYLLGDVNTGMQLMHWLRRFVRRPATTCMLCTEGSLGLGAEC